MASGALAKGRSPNLFVFNPFAEGYIGHGKAFTPVRQQAMLAEDLANLPQFLSEPDDIVLLEKSPSIEFLKSLQQAGLPVPQFVQLKDGRIDPDSQLCEGSIGGLRPWAWGPDSIRLFEPLFAGSAGEARNLNRYFNSHIAQLYSKAWSAGFLRKILVHCHEGPHAAGAEHWLCSEQEAGVAVDTLDDALAAIDAIRHRGHHQVVVKEAHGLAGHNAIRLWEPELLVTQHRWLAHALTERRHLVVEPWLEREFDFSVQLEMEPRGLKLCGYTGLINDRKGQFLANSAEPGYRFRLPAKVAAFFPQLAGTRNGLELLYDEIRSRLEAELKPGGFVGPVSIDAFVYRTGQGECRLKPVVEINPRYTMGRLTVELMNYAAPGSSGLFRLVSRAQARAEGFADLSGYGRSLSERFPLRLEGGKIRQGALCLNDPAHAKACLATFSVTP